MAGRYSSDVHVPIGPFLVFVGRVMDRTGLQRHALSEHAHVSYKWLGGRDTAGRETELVPVPVVDALCVYDGTSLWEVYSELGPNWDDPAHRTITAWCGRCEEHDPESDRFGCAGSMVVPDNEGCCMWCGEQVAEPELDASPLPELQFAPRFEETPCSDEEKFCATCGGEIPRCQPNGKRKGRREWARATYCSRDCQRNHARRERSHTHCEGCGDPISERQPNGALRDPDTRFCSRLCSNRALKGKKASWRNITFERSAA